MGVSVGMVGLGWFAQSFIELFRDHPEVSRIAICDLDPERTAYAASTYGISETYGALDDLLKSDVEAVVLITQPWLHFEHAMQALAAGKHVYCAVPSVYGTDADRLLEQLDALVAAVRCTGLYYMLGETTFFRREIMYCRRRAAAGDFGAFTYAECEYWHDIDSPTSNLREVTQHRWGADFGPDKRGGVPMFYPTHALAGVVSTMNTHMVSVSALGYQYADDDWFAPDAESGNVMANEVALYRASNGAVVRHAEFRRIGHPNREGVRIFGTEGSFLDGPDGAYWTTRANAEPLDLGEVREPLPEPLASNLGGHGGSHAYLVHEFVDSIKSGRMPRTNVWEAARYLAPGLVAHKSALRDGETMTIPDWGSAPDC